MICNFLDKLDVIEPAKRPNEVLDFATDLEDDEDKMFFFNLVCSDLKRKRISRDSIRAAPELEEVEREAKDFREAFEGWDNANPPAMTLAEKRWLLKSIEKDMGLRVSGRGLIKARAIRESKPIQAMEELAARSKTIGEALLNDVEFVGLGYFEAFKPMLLHKLSGIPEFLAAIQSKLDGVRITVHIKDGEQKVYSRTMEEMNFDWIVPTTVNCILDGEAIGNDKGRSFQQALSRENTRPVFFDVLKVNDITMTQMPLKKRLQVLTSILPVQYVLPWRVMIPAQELLDRELSYAVLDKFEGIVVKNLEAPYFCGTRSYEWLKFKPKPQSLVLLALNAKWSHSLFRSFEIFYKDGEENLSLGFVGGGFKETELHELSSMILENMESETVVEGSTYPIPPGLDIVFSVKFDYIMQARTGHLGLRFPRLERWGREAQIEDVATKEEVTELLLDEDGEPMSLEDF
jgi:DNA ligase-1